MINKSTAHALKAVRPAAVETDASGAAWLWSALMIHAVIMAWLISLIF